jgi:hypothetical protein
LRNRIEQLDLSGRSMRAEVGIPTLEQSVAPFYGSHFTIPASSYNAVHLKPGYFLVIPLHVSFS